MRPSLPGQEIVAVEVGKTPSPVVDEAVVEALVEDH